MDALDDEGLAKDKQPGMHEMETDDEMITTGWKIILAF